MASSTLDLSKICGGFCAGGFPSDGMDALLRSWFRQHFSSPDNLPDNLKNRIWTEQLSTSMIFIDIVDEWLPQTTDQRPAIMFRDDGFQHEPRGIGNRLSGGGGLQALQNNQAAPLIGQYTILCVSSKPAECRALAVEVFKELTANGRLIAQNFGLGRLISGPVTGRKLVEQANQQFVMAIPVVYGVFWSWQVFDKNAPVINKVIPVVTMIGS